jgi:hypothetical protein
MALETRCSSGSNGAALTRRDAMPIRGMDMGSKCHRAICPNGAMHTSPGCQPWEPHPKEEVCSERTPHRQARDRCPRHKDDAAFLQNAGFFFRVYSQGWHLGLLGDAPYRAWDWKRGVRVAPPEPCQLNGTRFPRLSQGAPLGLGLRSGVCDGYSYLFKLVRQTAPFNPRWISPRSPSYVSCALN